MTINFNLTNDNDRNVTPLLVLCDGHIDFVIKNDEGVSQTVLTMRKDGTIRTWELEPEQASKLGLIRGDRNHIEISNPKE